MNKKVLKTMIALVIVFLLACYILKIFFPEQFVMSIENENLIKIGKFIDDRIWLAKICSGITTFIGMFLYECAVTKKWKLNWKEFVEILSIIIITKCISLYDNDISNGISTIAMFIIPMLNNAKLKEVSIVYSVHYISQLLSIKIRNLPIYFSQINSIIAICMTFECYLWLILFYLYFNCKRSRKIMGDWMPPLYGKSLKRYQNKIDKINKKIKSLEEDKKVYEEIVAKQTSDTPLVEKSETKN